MSEAFHTVMEEPLYGVNNASAILESANPAASIFTDSFAFQGKLVWGLSVLALLVLARAFGAGKQKLPAGVKPLPILPGLPWAGRFWDIPEPGIEAAWHFGALHKKYGPIYAWKVMGITHVWIETDKIARDLFVSRQRNYCDRNELPAAVGVREGSEVLPLMGYGDAWRRYKNFMHMIMRHANPRAFYGWPVSENKKTLRRLMEQPEKWSEHLIVHCGRTIASIAWGDPAHATKLLTIIPVLLKAVSPAGPIINKLTFLANLPESISPFKQEETRRKQEMQDAFYEGLQDVKNRIQDGTARDCWSKLWLENEKGMDQTNLNWHEAAHAIGSSSFVAIATIGGPLHAFFLAMCHYPAWQAKVQEELDRVCPNHLPTMEDIPRLPLLRATVKEIIRWRQSTPLGVPHGALEDDVYDGYLIPKGAILHANNFLISREPSMFPEPEDFKPERWLDPKYPTYKPLTEDFPNLRGDIAFGYGNRGCPGVDLTSTELLTLLGALLWAFEIKRPEGKVGRDNPLPWYEVAPWVITMSKPFKCDIKVRSEAKRQFILAEAPDAGYMIKDSEKERTDRWDIVRPAGEEFYTWEGLTTPLDPMKMRKSYPHGV